MGMHGKPVISSRKKPAATNKSIKKPSYSFQYPFCSSLPVRRLFCWTLTGFGLICQVWSISSVYFQYSTRVDIDIEVPFKLSMPALSICLNLVYNINDLYPEPYPTRESVPPKTALPINILSQLPIPPITINCTTPFDELTKFNETKPGYACENYSPVLISIHYTEGINLHKCFTYFYRNATSSPFLVNYAESKDFFNVELISSENVSVSIFVHNPIEILLVSAADTFTFYTNATSELILSSSKLITKLLPAPFRTSCIDYDDVRFGRTGCIFECLERLSMEKCGVWPSSVPADPWLPYYFNRADLSCSLTVEQKESCTISKETCPNQCVNLWYTTTLVTLHQPLTPTNLTRIFIRRPSEVEFTYNYTPRLDQIEYLCYVASCFGIWLGISFLDILESSIDAMKNKLSAQETQIMVVTPTYIYFSRNRVSSISSTATT